MIPINDLSRSAPNEAEISVLAEVLRSGNYILGGNVAAFESDLADYIGVNHAVAVASGTDALVLALRALGVKSGDRVCTSPNAGGYTTTALRLIGAYPRFVDTDEFGRMSVSALANILEKEANIKGVVLTHLYGLMGDAPGIRRLTNQLGLFLIEDCAQSIGASLGSQKAGGFGDVSTFSFYPTKNLGALGDAGAVLTDSDNLAGRIKMLRQYGWSERYHSDLEFGVNSRMDEVQGSILRLRLGGLELANARRKAIWESYRQSLEDSNWKIIGSKGEDFVAHLAVLLAPNSEVRSRAIVRLNELGVATAIHYPVLDYDQRAWTQFIPESRCQVAEDTAGRILSVPMFPSLTASEVSEVAMALSEVAG